MNNNVLNINQKVHELAERYFGDYKESNNEISPRLCPMCFGGRDSNGSGDTFTFYVNVNTGLWYCHRGHHERDSGCSNRGGLRELAEFFGEKASYSASNRITSINTFKKKVYVRPDPDEILPLTDEIVDYFKSRKITKETLETFRIGADSNGNIVFPFYRDNQLIMNKYRKPKKFIKGVDNMKEWASKDAEPILFNMDNVSFNKPLTVTEGEVDCLSLYEAGVSNVVSVPMGCNNTEWIMLCWDWLDKFPQIILFGDADAAGIEMINTVKRRLGEDRCMLPPEYPEFIYNEKDFGRTCKDANEILFLYGPEKLKELVDSCEPAPVKGILNLADVQMEDPSNVPRLLSKIPQLDLITGGFNYGGLSVFTGELLPRQSVMSA